jgi:hypothetical protein
MKMLELITLQTIELIFDNNKKVSSKSKMLYINCLIGYFKGKIATTENSMEFTLFVLEMKNYKKWEQYFIELHHAEIIKIHPITSSIIFINKWGQFIDRTKLDLAENQLLGSMLKNASELKEEMFDNKSLYELCGMKFKMTPAQVTLKIELFCKEQDSANKKYKDFGEASQHFNYWIAKGSNAPTQSKASSSSKILGLD